MDKSKYGVHKTHCCILHGCKYANAECPVVSGEIEQKYICEDCEWVGIKSIQHIKDIREHGAEKCPRCGFHLKINK